MKTYRAGGEVTFLVLLHEALSPLALDDVLGAGRVLLAQGRHMLQGFLAWRCLI